MELRNPKKMYLMNGEEYDKDVRGEIMDETSEFYDLPDDDDKVKKHKQNTAIAKKHIIAFSQYRAELYALKNAKTPADVMREEVAKRLDVEGIMDYWLFTYFTNNFDGINGNWQFATWDGTKWFLLPYDLDCTFGLMNYGYFIYPPTVCNARGAIGMGYHPFYWIKTYFMDDVYERYAQLRERKIFDTDNVMNMLYAWKARIDDDMYAMEWERWPNSPCISQTIINDGWEWVQNWSNWADYPAYDNGTTYYKGDIVRWHERKWMATKTMKGVSPCSQEGYTDSPERVREWIEGRLVKMDALMHYTPKPVIGDVNGDGVADITDVSLLVAYVITGTGDINIYQADLNEDRDVNITDITFLVNNILHGTNANTNAMK
ncbi:MAG: CotH kinase family protein [Prevotella sp.]|nr:CotH kinase family protein [Prevotella sp.]